MTNIIYILFRANWRPNQFNCWVDDKGDTWVLTDSSVSLDVVSSALIKRYVMLDLAIASSHYLGLGMQNGIDFHTTMRLSRSLGSNRYPFKCMLETLLAAATWPAE